MRKIHSLSGLVIEHNFSWGRVCWFKWLIQTTDFSPVGAKIGIKIDPDGFHVMKKSEYSGMFGDYSSYSAEYDEISDAEEVEHEEAPYEE